MCKRIAGGCGRVTGSKVGIVLLSSLLFSACPVISVVSLKHAVGSFGALVPYLGVINSLLAGSGELRTEDIPSGPPTTYASSYVFLFSLPYRLAVVNAGLHPYYEGRGHVVGDDWMIG
jgi:hypothetical protein